MATQNKMLAYRPDDRERALIEALGAKMGLPYSRVLGLAVRVLAERENVSLPTKEEGEAK